MHNRIISILLVLILLSSGLFAIAGCAGGSRGTGVRFNRSSDSSPLDQDDEDENDDNKKGGWR